MSEAIASESRPAPPSEPSRVFASHVQIIKEDVVCAHAQLCSTFPTDQVPQPVPRDTIVLTTMAAPTDSRGAACLPQSAPTVQAQVSSTGCYNSCDDCTQATLHQYHRGPMCPMDRRGGRAGPPVALKPPSVIPSSSCPASTRPIMTSHQVSHLAVTLAALVPLRSTATKASSSISLPSVPEFSGGNYNLKSNNKMQSVNVICSLAANNGSINYKGNDILSSETTVTEPKIEPQRNTVQSGDLEPDTAARNNNSVKLLDIVNVNDKNFNKHGALILFPNNASRCHDNDANQKSNIPDNDIPVVLLPTVQGKKYSNYPPTRSFKQTSEIDYALNMGNMSTFNAESESKSGTVFKQHEHTSNDLPSNITCKFLNNDDNDFTDMTILHKQSDNRTLEQMIIEQATSAQREEQWRLIYNRPLGLCGGGESSLNSGTTGWGTPPAANTNNNNGNNPTGWGSSAGTQNSNTQNNWNNNPSRNAASGPGQGPPNTQDGASSKSGNSNSNAAQNPNQNQAQTVPAGNQGWNQNSTANANKPGAGAPPNAAGPPSAAPTGPGPTTTPSTKQQLEQLNSMREALFSQDGWGGQHVNQDTNWDIPSSPEPGVKDGPGGAPLWKPPVNNGTELWETNLRNGGQPPPQPVQKTPWGHTPTTNIGGTWGEDDDVAESSNVWTGVPNNQQQWGGGGAAAGNGGSGGGMWCGPKKENDWSGGGGASSTSGWGDPRADPRTAGIDPREAMRASSMDPRNAGSGSGADLRESMRMLGDPMREAMRETIRDQRDLRGITDMRGDPRGISGRLNGDAMWGPPPQAAHHISHHQPPGKMVGPAPNGVNQWAGPPPKEMGMTGGKPSGWEEPSPPSQRRNMPNFDDGTSLWGNPNQQPNRMGASGKLSHWTDMPTGGGPMGGRGGACPPGMVSGSRKPADASLWSRNGSWGDDSQPHWAEDAWSKAKGPAQAPWDPEIDWHKQGPTGPKLTKEIVWNSKQFRHLVEMGYKKEDVENALRLRDMNLDDALDMLSPLRPGVDTWRGSSGASVGAPGRHDDHTPYDHSGNTGPYGQRFAPSGPGQMQFPPIQSGNAPNLMNNMTGSGGNPSLASINSVSPAVVQKMLAAGSGAGGGGSGGGAVQGYPSAGGQGRVQAPQAPQSQPSTQQLRMLVQQIQMAVQAGYLNHQILNQPLAPQTLILLNQLLQHIKLLQTLMQQHSVFQSQGPLGKANSQNVLHVSVQITKTKQQINNLQNQIAANQAIYVKQQMGGGGGGPADFFKNANLNSSMHDPITALQGNFSDLAINKEPPTSYASQQQSRLTQWIKSDKDEGTGVEFSRAPGSVTKPPAPHASPSMNLGLGQADGPWSTGRSADTGGWPDAGTDGPDGAVKDAWPTAQASPAAFTDLVPEFEPGKPWKGNQMKSIEDDPSITPGSVVRSPLSLATIKDTEIFSAAPPSSTAPSKSSPTVDALQPLSLSSSTWSFNPPASTTSSFTSPLNKIGATKGTWGDIAPQPTAVTSELWGAPMGKRGPPPGLAKGVLGSAGATTNGWGGLGGSRSTSGNWGSTNWGSSWLLLRNLTAQIDGSTLQTLCKQHGPLQSFHLYLNHGFALAKYSSREEAIKAQTALNNCVLGNTTILAESPGDSEVNTLMQNLAQQSGSSGGAWRGGSKATPGGGGAGADTWGTACWPPNPSVSASLWTPSTMDSETQRATPSSLNSFLPGDLLGGESM